MPPSIAMAATDTPGRRLCATSSRLNSALCSRRRRGALTTGLSMMCNSGLMHTIAGALDHAILLIRTVPGNRALRARLPYTRNNLQYILLPDTAFAALLAFTLLTDSKMRVMPLLPKDRPILVHLLTTKHLVSDSAKGLHDWHGNGHEIRG